MSGDKRSQAQRFSLPLGLALREGTWLIFVHRPVARSAKPPHLQRVIIAIVVVAFNLFLREPSMTGLAARRFLDVSAPHVNPEVIAGVPPDSVLADLHRSPSMPLVGPLVVARFTSWPQLDGCLSSSLHVELVHGLLFPAGKASLCHALSVHYGNEDIHNQILL